MLVTTPSAISKSFCGFMQGLAQRLTHQPLHGKWNLSHPDRIGQRSNRAAPLLLPVRSNVSRDTSESVVAATPASASAAFGVLGGDAGVAATDAKRCLGYKGEGSACGFV